MQPPEKISGGPAKTYQKQNLQEHSPPTETKPLEETKPAGTTPPTAKPANRNQSKY